MHYDNAISNRNVPTSAYEARLKALLGNLVDFVGIRQRANIQIGVRLIHKSLSTYLDRSAWIQKRLPVSLQEQYPNFLWRRMAFAIVNQAEADGVIVQGKVVPVLQSLNDPYLTLPRIPEILDEAWINDKCWTECNWEAKREVFRYALTECFDIDSKEFHKSGIIDSELNFRTQSSALALVHFLRCSKCLDYTAGWWSIRRVERVYRFNVLGWVLNVLHGSYRWATVELKLISESLSRDQCEDLFDLALPTEPWRDGARAPEHIELLETFTSYGLQVEGRHICGIISESSGLYSLRSRAVIEATKWRRYGSRWQPEHDRDCSLSKVRSTSVWTHWLKQHGGLHTLNIAFMLHVIILLGGDVGQEPEMAKDESFFQELAKCKPRSEMIRMHMVRCLANEAACLYEVPQKDFDVKYNITQKKGFRRRNKITEELGKGWNVAIEQETLVLQRLRTATTNVDVPGAATNPRKLRSRYPDRRIDVHNSLSWGGFDCWDLLKLLKETSKTGFDRYFWLEDLARQQISSMTGSGGVFGNFVVDIVIHNIR